MNRSLWVSVGATIAVMGSVDYAARPSGAVRDIVSTSIEVLDQLGQRVSWDVAGISVIAALVVLAVSLRRRRASGHPEPWRTVIALARKGRSISDIAHVTRQSHDAVRILLAPVAFDRQRGRGKSFRSRGTNDAETPARRQRRPGS